MHSLLLLVLLISRAICFTHLDVENGLSQSSVFAIEQDKDGCMWFGTYDGLCRYDGYDFTVFRNDENPDSIEGNVIRSLKTDSSGSLWIGTDKGISLIKPGEKIFRNISTSSKNFYVRQFAELDANHIIVRTSKDNYIIDKRTFEYTCNDESTGISNDEAFFKNTELGLISMTNDGNVIIRSSSDNKKIYKGKRISRVMDVIATIDSCLYVASDGEGFWKIDLKQSTAIQYEIGSLRARSLCRDTKGNIWIGTANNLFVLDTSNETVTEISPDSSERESLSNSSIRSLYCDKLGGVWVGTFFGGINYYSPWRNHFGSIRYKSNDRDIVGCINEDSRHRLWVGTFRDGILRFEPDFSNYKNMGMTGSFAKDETNDIKVIEFTGDKVYIGAELGGLTKYDSTTGSSWRLDVGEQFTSVYSILETSQGSYWLGTNTGLFKLDPSNDKVEQVGEFGLIRKIHQTTSKDIWLGGDGFLARCVEIRQKDGSESLVVVREYKDIFWVQDINNIGEHVWIGTRNGLYKYSVGRDMLEKIESDEKRISVKAIETGGNGKLWLSTENGLYSYDSCSGKLRRYGNSDGLLCNTFNIGARKKLSDGTICFGGTEGITYFKPEEIIPQTYTPSPLLTKITVDGETAGYTDMGILDIPAGNNVISIRFSAPDYVSWKNLSFKYKLEGFDNRWHNADISRTATYSNLPKGRYKFMVESSNADGVKSQAMASLQIKIHPHWYQTTLFIVICILASICFAAYFVYNHIRGIRKDTSEEIEGLKLRLYAGPKADGELSKDDSEFLKEVLNVVNANLTNEKFNADMFAKEMGLSRTGLHTKLKTITGESALEFIKKVRFDQACTLLREGGLTIAQVGYKVGYSSPAYFTSSFKKRIGKTPKQYQDITRRK